MVVLVTSVKRFVVIGMILSLIAVQSASAQRPSFAGSRPPDGQTQKDKYATTSVTAAASASANAGGSTAGIQNRFGAPQAPVTNQLPFGQSQKPPVGEVVTPQSTYVQLPATTDGVVFEDRLGEVDSNVIRPAAVIPTATPPPGHPLDAHGDQQLIDKLNQLPVDKQPFWFINYKAIEAQRNGTATNFAPAQASRGSFAG